jgi:hypothetical protein
MPETKISIRCDFRSSGYDPEEIDELREDFSSVASIQPRRHGIPEAGGSYDIAFVITWAGTTILSGVIGNFAYDALKALAAKFASFWLRKEARADYPPETYLLELHFDDLDIHIEPIDPEVTPDANFLLFETLSRIDAIILTVRDHLTSGPLLEIERQVVRVPEPHPTSRSTDLHGLLFSRPWTIAGTLVGDNWTYYPHERRLEKQN